VPQEPLKGAFARRDDLIGQFFIGTRRCHGTCAGPERRLVVQSRTHTKPMRSVLHWPDSVAVMYGLRQMRFEPVLRQRGVVQNVPFPGNTGNQQSFYGKGISRFECYPDLNHA